MKIPAWAKLRPVQRVLLFSLFGALTLLWWPKTKKNKVFRKVVSETSFHASLWTFPPLAERAALGQLPSSGDIHRDLFLFETHPKLPPEKTPAPVVEDQASREVREAELRQQEVREKLRKSYRFIGTLRTSGSPLQGVFQKDQESLLLKAGDRLDSVWLLTSLSEEKACLQYEGIKELNLVWSVDTTRDAPQKPDGY